MIRRPSPADYSLEFGDVRRVACDDGRLHWDLEPLASPSTLAATDTSYLAVPRGSVNSGGRASESALPASRWSPPGPRLRRARMVLARFVYGMGGHSHPR
ncbi:MAG TPA: hypothetical protein VGH33_15685 [Isosphaeraceae bacterium]